MHVYPKTNIHSKRVCLFAITKLNKSKSKSNTYHKINIKALLDLKIDINVKCLSKC